MIATRLPVDIALPVFPEGSERSLGIHASGLIRSLGIESGKVSWGDPLEDLQIIETGSEAQGAWWAAVPRHARIRIHIGIAWERWWLTQMAHWIIPHPAELTLEGVFLSPDGESLELVVVERKNKLVVAIHEIKATYKSVNTVGDLSSDFMWTMQTKGYCKARGTTLCFLHILYLCNDYSYPISPDVHLWKLQYTQQEVDDAWERLMSYKRHRLSQMREDLMKDTE